MSEMDFKQPGFAYSGHGLFTKKHMQKFKEAEDPVHILQN